MSTNSTTTFALELTLANPNDSEEIAHLAEKIWRAHYTSIIGEAQVEYMLNLMYSREGITDQINNGQEFYFIVENGIRVGYLSITKPEFGQLNLSKFYIDTLEQGRGIGKRAFEVLLQMNQAVKTVRLTVNRKNFKSINFYFGLGFVIEQVKDFDIGEGYLMEDFVMCLKRP